MAKLENKRTLTIGKDLAVPSCRCARPTVYVDWLAHYRIESLHISISMHSLRRFSTIAKSDTFYETHAESNPRRYFYNVDLQGRLFLEETLPKNIATSIKDDRFLDFFFRRVRPILPKEEALLAAHNIGCEEYPFVSPCGKELNFIRPAATPIVFHAFDAEKSMLIFAGSQSQAFQSSHLAISKDTGRLYHRCTHLEKKTAGQEPQFALIRSAVVVGLSDQIAPLEDDNDDDENSSGLAFVPNHDDDDNNTPIPIPWLPRWAEPGAWAMPFSEDE